MVVEWVPVGIQHGRRVAAEKRNLVWDLAPLVEGNNGKCAATARLPVYREIFGVGLQLGWRVSRE